MGGMKSLVRVLLARVVCFCLLILLFSVFVPLAEATHFRFGHLTWKPRPDLAPNTVEFTFTGGFRRNGYPGTAGDAYPQVGDVITEWIGGTNLCFGDGVCTGVLQFEVTAYNVSENWVLGRAVLSPHTYPSSSPVQANSGSCCRISAIDWGSGDPHINNPDGSYNLQTWVDPTGANTPPVSSGVPIVQCQLGGVCNFNIPASDVEGDPLSWRLSTAAEAGSGFFSQPSLTLHPSTGIVTWNTLGASLGLYSTQDMIEDGKSGVPIDYFVKVVPFTAGNPPVIDVPPSPLGGSEHPQIVAAGNPLQFFIAAHDPDVLDTVTLGHAGLPSNAHFSVSPPSNTAQGVFSWTPTVGDIGDHVVTFTAADDHGNTAPPHAVTIRVVSADFVNLKINKWGWRWVSPGQGFFNTSPMVYGIEYRNVGTKEAADVTVVDDLPAEVDYISSSAGVYDSATHSVTFHPGMVFPGVVGYRMVVVRVHPGLVQPSITNCAAIASPSAESDSSDNADCWTTLIQTAHDPNDKSVDPSGNVAAGGTMNYTIRYENTGAGIAFGVSVTDELDSDLDETTLFIHDGGTYNASTRTITWNIGDLSPTTGGSVTFSANVRSSAVPGTVISNFATIHFPSVPEHIQTPLVVNTIPSVAVTTTTLPKSKVGMGYSAALGASGGDAPYAWQVVDGMLPPGLIVKGETGKILGFPKHPGTYNFFVQTTDAQGVTSDPTPLAITIGPGEEDEGGDPSGKKSWWALGCGSIQGPGGGAGAGPSSGNAVAAMLILFSPILLRVFRRRRSL